MPVKYVAIGCIRQLSTHTAFAAVCSPGRHRDTLPVAVVLWSGWGLPESGIRRALGGIWTASGSPIARVRGPGWLGTDVYRFSRLASLGDDLPMEHRTQLHDTLGEVERRRLRPEVVLSEEDRPIGPVDPDQPVRGLLDVAEDGF